MSLLLDGPSQTLKERPYLSMPSIIVVVCRTSQGKFEDTWCVAIGRASGAAEVYDVTVPRVVAS